MHLFALSAVCAALAVSMLQPAIAAAQTDSLPSTQAAPAVAAQVSAMPVSTRARIPGMAIAAVTVAGATQAFGVPEGWPRTWGGYARRVGDQAGFIAIEETVRLSLGATVNWVPDTRPCGGRANPAKWRAFVPRLGCAVRETLLLRTPEGGPRPNFPLVLGAVSASAASTRWRPDTRTPSTALSVAATRTAFVLGGMIVSQLIGDWRRDQR